MPDERFGSGCVVAAVALSLALGACSSDPFSAAVRADEIHAVEVVTVPATSPQGMVLSVVLSNQGSTQVEITGVTVDADPGLDVDVLGQRPTAAGGASEARLPTIQM